MAKGPTVSTTFNAKDKISGPMQKMKKNMKTFAVGASVGITAAAVGIGKLIKEASKIEDAVAGFTPLLGGIEKANELVDQLNKTAATTPFQFESIAASAKQLLPVMNQDIERTTETFRMLGDTAGGNAQKLETITRGFTKAMLKGKVDMESLNMIAEAGVPIYSELADSMGVSVAEMMKLSSAGKISSEDLEDAFRNMTKEGGIFFKGMEIASKTLTGRISTLKDNIALTAAALGKSLLPVVKMVTDELIEIAGSIREWVEANHELIQQTITGVIETIKNVVLWFIKYKDLIISITVAFTAYKVAILAVAAAQNIMVAALAVAKFVQFYGVLIKMVAVTKSWTAVQFALNTALAANPIGAVVLAVTALAALILLVIKRWKAFKTEFGEDATVGSFLNPFDEETRRNGGVSNPYERQFGQGRGIAGRTNSATGGTTNSSELSVNFNNTPSGTSFSQKGQAPGITVNTGRGARL